MKPQYKFILILIFFLSNNIAYSNDKKVVFIDMDLIFGKSLVGKSLNEKIKSLDQNNKKELKKIEDQIKLEDEKINSQKNILSETELKNKISELNKMIQKYKNISDEKNKNLKKIKIDSSKIILKNLNPILSEYSKKNSISLVLQKKDIIIGINELNITDDIIEILDKKIKKIEFN